MFKNLFFAMFRERGNKLIGVYEEGISGSLLGLGKSIIKMLCVQK